MNIVLCTSPHVRHPAVLQADFEPGPGLMYSFVPIGLLSLAAVIRSTTSHHTQLFDINDAINKGQIRASGNFYHAAAKAICSLAPDVIGFMTDCDSYHHVLQVCRAVRAFRPQTSIMLGGPHASATAATSLADWDCIDAICIGEGERSVVPLVESLALIDRYPVPGTLIRSRHGGILECGRSELIEHLDSIPIPAFDLYQPAEGEEIFLEVGRGCPFSCTFCSTAPYWGRRHRVKSPQRIVREIEHIRSLFGSRRFHFTHDLFTTDRRWVLAVADALAAIETVPAWTCSARADRVDPDLLERMALGGCNAIYFGVESGSQRVLSAIKKDISWDVTEQAIDSCLSVGIQPNAGLIVGFPEDDELSIRATFDAYTRLLRRGAKPVHIFAFCPFNGADSFAATGVRGIQKHFVDIPLPLSLDEANRQLVVEQPGLFSAYRRVASEEVWAMSEGFIEGVDEFTPLVEACLLPSLIFAAHDGEMCELYKGWLAWIASRNDKMNRSIHRRFYGGPREYACYLCEKARYTPNVRSDLPAYLDLLQRSFGMATVSGPLSMATYRSATTSPSISKCQLEIGCTIAENVIDVIGCEWDLSGLFNWVPGERLSEPIRLPCGYVLQRTRDDRGIRLLQVSVAILELLESLRKGPADVASLWATRALRPSTVSSAGVEDVIQSIIDASQAGLVSISAEG